MAAFGSWPWQKGCDKGISYFLFFTSLLPRVPCYHRQQGGLHKCTKCTKTITLNSTALPSLASAAEMELFGLDSFSLKSLMLSMYLWT